jgi:cell division protein FtsA
MAQPNIITGIDIGSGIIKIVSVFKKPKEKKFEVVACEAENSLGVRKGVVVDVSKVSEIISRLVGEVEKDCQKEISDAYVSIGGCHMYCEQSHNLVSVSRADKKISREDIDRVLSGTQVPLLSNKEIIDIFPKDFAVDGVKNIKDALGLEGIRLEADILALCGFSPYIKNSLQAVAGAGLGVSDEQLMPSVLASAKAVLKEEEKELGVAVLDIGAGNMGMAVFQEGNLEHMAIFPVGSANITSDIAIFFKIDFNLAEKIKLEYGCCKCSGKDKKIKIEGEEGLEISHKALSKVIEARIDEFFDLANKELKSISKQGALPAGIIITGGGAKLPGIREFAKDKFKLPCRIGAPEGFSLIANDPSFSTACGLILEGIEKEDLGGRENSGGKIKEAIKSFFSNFVP